MITITGVGIRIRYLSAFSGAFAIAPECLWKSKEEIVEDPWKIFRQKFSILRDTARESTRVNFLFPSANF
jgi:hypothetical protein